MNQTDLVFEKAIFAGGCFWCLEAVFTQVKGVVTTRPGYTGGHTEQPNYEQVCTGKTGHYEALEVTYDAQRVQYQELLEIFWRNIDPLDGGGQFVDRGSQYETAIFYFTEKQKQLAEQSLQQIATLLQKTIATKILPAGPFYAAEDYHQKYYQHQPLRYEMYKHGSGREKRLQELWLNES